MLFNEGSTLYQGRVTIRLSGQPVAVDLGEGKFTRIAGCEREDHQTVLPVSLGPHESLVLLFDAEAYKNSQPPFVARQSLDLDGGWSAKIVRHHRVGAHNYEIEENKTSSFQPITLGSWNELVGADFSGVVAYRHKVKLPESWLGKRLRIQLGKVDYSAKVLVNDRDLGIAQWSPMEIEFSSDTSNPEFDLLIEVANTLANELTSERVKQEWSQRKGLGWPGPYHARAIEFEKDSRSGGLFGPVKIELSD